VLLDDLEGALWSGALTELVVRPNKAEPRIRAL
jgi:hypothetical protein